MVKTFVERRDLNVHADGVEGPAASWIADIYLVHYDLVAEDNPQSRLGRVAEAGQLASSQMRSLIAMCLNAY